MLSGSGRGQRPTWLPCFAARPRHGWPGLHMLTGPCCPLQNQGLQNDARDPIMRGFRNAPARAPPRLHRPEAMLAPAAAALVALATQNARHAVCARDCRRLSIYLLSPDIRSALILHAQSLGVLIHLGAWPFSSLPISASCLTELSCSILALLIILRLILAHDERTGSVPLSRILPGRYAVPAAEHINPSEWNQHLPTRC